MIRIGLVSFVLGIVLAASAAAAPCTRAPVRGGDPAIAGATALQVELCRLRGRSSDSAAVVARAKHSGAFDVEFAAWTFELARVRVEVISAAAPGGEMAPSFKQRAGAVFAINGGFFDFGPQQELRPVGLLIEKGRIKKPLARSLSGTLLINGQQIEILTTASVVTTMGYTHGLQSRPLLVEPGNKLGMRGNDGVRVPRSAVCLPDSKHVTFIYAGKSGLSLFELATLLHAPVRAGGFGCDVALNLDGGPSTQVAAEVDGAPFERLEQNVANAIVVLKR